MNPLPSGTVTFLFTDIEGSTRLLQQLGPAYALALEEHRRLLRAAFDLHGGHEVDTQGDAFFVAFQRAGDAVAAAADAQRALHTHPWPQDAPLRVRMGLHTGEPQLAGSGYVGLDVHRGARVMAAGHGGQVLLSQTVQNLVEEHLPPDLTLRDAGEHRLKDLTRVEHLYQLLISGLPTDFPPLKTLNSQPNNLPAQMTSFVGREQQLGEVEQLLSGTRLLTLTGAGGTGKTRLSLQVGAHVLENYADGVWLVELAPLSDPDLVPQAVASALSVREEPGQSMTQTLQTYLASKKLLLVLDNCEHLLQGAAQLANALLRSCPDLRILASSREALGIAGEQIYRVPSLSTPNLREIPSAESLSQYEAVRLFIERAVAASPAFAVTNANAPALAQLCHRLDGIPLAIELAAARVKALSVEKLLERLDDRFRLLTGGSRTALPRQQTLRALIDWSYDLLSESERALLRRLSVFAGGWTLEAAESVCVGEPVEEWEVLDFLTGLVDKSLVVYEEASERYRLLETVRQYATDRLRESGDETVREQHVNFFSAWAEEAKSALSGAQATQWLERLDQEHDNLRAVLSWCKTPAATGEATLPRAETGLRLSAALFRFWMMHGTLSEGREHLLALLSQAGEEAPIATRAEALRAAGTLSWGQGDYTAARALLEQGLALYRQANDRSGVASSLNNLGLVAWNQSDYAAARALYEESLAMQQEIGDKQGIANSLNNLGLVVSEQGDYAAAQSLYQECLVIRREIGNQQGIALALTNLGGVACYQGDYAAARPLQEECLAIGREIGDKNVITLALTNLGCVASYQGDTAAARALHEECLTMGREIGDKHVIARSLHNIGNVALMEGNCAAARAWYQEGLQLFRELGAKQFIAQALEGCARLAAVCDADNEGNAQRERAARLGGAAEVLREAIGSPLPPAERAELDTDIAAARAALGEAAFAAAWATGRALTMEQAIETALEKVA